jgi:hypothetical protein
MNISGAPVPLQPPSAVSAIISDSGHQCLEEQAGTGASGSKTLLGRLAAICSVILSLQPPPQAEQEHPQGSLAGIQLTQAIQACTTIKQVQELVDLHGAQMNAIHLSAALSHLPQITATGSRERQGQHAEAGDGSLTILLQRLEQIVLQRLPTSLRRLMLRAPDKLQDILSDRVAAGSLQLALSDVRLVADINWRSASLSSSENEQVDQPQYTAVLQVPAEKPVDPAWYTPWDLGPRQLATAVHGFAKLRHSPSGEWMSRFLHTTEQYLCEHTSTLSSSGYRSDKCFTPQELSMMGWGLAQMQRMAEQQQQAGKHQGHDEMGGRTQAFTSQCHEPSQRAGTSWFTAYCKACQMYVQASVASGPTSTGSRGAPLTPSPQDLATIPWALAVMGARPAPGFLHAWCTAVRAQVRRMSSRDCGQLLWGLARLTHRPQLAWLQQLVARVEELAVEGRVGPHESAITMWALARMQYDPGESLVSALLLPLCAQQSQRQHAAMTAMRARATTDAASDQQGSSQSTGMDLGPVVPAKATGRQRVARGFTARDAGMLLWALGVLRRRPAVRDMHALVKAVMQQGRQVNDQDLGHLFWALARLSYCPPPGLRNRLLHALGRAVRRQCLGPSAMAQVLWGLARAEYPVPPHLAQGVFHAAVCQAEQLTPQGAVLALYLAARHQLSPPHQQLHLLLSRIRSIVVSAAAAGLLGPQTSAVYSHSGEQATQVCAVPQFISQPLGDRAAAVCSSQLGQGRVTGQTLGLLFWSLVKLKYRPSGPWTRSVLAHTVEVRAERSKMRRTPWGHGYLLNCWVIINLA